MARSLRPSSGPADRPIIRNAEYTLDAADSSADAGPDRAAHNAPDRARRAVAGRRPLLGAANDALSLRGDRQGQGGPHKHRQYDP
jgi:hypothetical protein